MCWRRWWWGGLFTESYGTLWRRRHRGSGQCGGSGRHIWITVCVCVLGYLSLSLSRHSRHKTARITIEELYQTVFLSPCAPLWSTSKHAIDAAVNSRSSISISVFPLVTPIVTGNSYFCQLLPVCPPMSNAALMMNCNLVKPYHYCCWTKHSVSYNFSYNSTFDCNRFSNCIRFFLLESKIFEHWFQLIWHFGGYSLHSMTPLVCNVFFANARFQPINHVAGEKNAEMTSRSAMECERYRFDQQSLLLVWFWAI